MLASENLQKKKKFENTGFTKQTQQTLMRCCICHLIWVVTLGVLFVGCYTEKGLIIKTYMQLLLNAFQLVVAHSLFAYMES